MRKGRVITALFLALTLLCAAAYGERWQAAEENLPRFRTLLDLLGELTAPALLMAVQKLPEDCWLEVLGM